MDITTTIKETNDRVRACIDKCNELKGMSLYYPTIEFTLKGKTSGRAWYQKHMIELNIELLAHNKEEYFQRTIPHEVAHLAVYSIYGNRASAHGREWKRIMMHLDAPVKRCHNYDMSVVSTARTYTRYAYVCETCSNTTKIGIKQYNKLKRGAKYKNSCGHVVTLGGVRI